MQIAGIQKCSAIDFPGKLSIVLFLAGCNYNCYFCHNRQIISSNCSSLDEREVIDFLKRRQGLIDAVVISGGEPTINEDLRDLILKIRNLGYKIKLDSNGSNSQMIKSLLEEEIVDYFAIDYKAPFSQYPKICQCTSQGVQDTINLLISSKADYEVRTTMIPEIDLRSLIEMAKSVSVLKKYFLQKYIFPSGQETPLLKLKHMANTIRVFQPNVFVRGEMD